MSKETLIQEMNHIWAEQNWDDSSMASIAIDFIEKTNSMYGFIEYLKERQAAENNG